uniref:Fibronectin type-III domain-containing protein n=1 Tax=Echinostoma caproni TaxID=27848 RepID=A0A183B827_9TREM
LEVSSAMLDSSLSPTGPGDFTLGHVGLGGSELPQPQYSLVIDELEANTVYDVQIRPVYNSPTLGHVNEANSPMGRTSCRTLMLRDQSDPHKESLESFHSKLHRPTLCPPDSLIKIHWSEILLRVICCTGGRDVCE